MLGIHYFEVVALFYAEEVDSPSVYVREVECEAGAESLFGGSIPKARIDDSTCYVFFGAHLSVFDEGAYGAL